MYQTTCIQIKKNQYALFSYCEEFTNLAKLFKNSVIFRCRQLLSVKNKPTFKESRYLCYTNLGKLYL